MDSTLPTTATPTAPPTCMAVLLAAVPTPRVVLGDRTKDGIDGGWYEKASADTDEEHARQVLEVGSPDRRDGADLCEAGNDEREPSRCNQLCACQADEPRRSERSHGQHAGDREHPQPGPERGVAEVELEELRQDEKAPQ